MARPLHLLCTVLLFIPALPAGAEEIVRWVDDEGRVHFGNRPKTGREETVDLSRGRQQTNLGRPAPARGGTSWVARPGVSCRKGYKQTPGYHALPARERLAHDRQCARQALNTRTQRVTVRKSTAEQEALERKREEIRRFADDYVASERERLRDAPARQAREQARREADCQGRYGRSCRDLETWKERAIASCKRRNLSRDCEDPAWLATQKPRTTGEIGEIKRKRRRRAARAQWEAQVEAQSARH